MFAVFRSPRLGISTVMLAAFTLLAARCWGEGDNRAYLQFNAPSHEEFNSAVNFAEDHGAVLLHRFFPYSAVGTVPDGAAALLEASDLINHVFVGPVSELDIGVMEKHEAYLAQAYNNLFFASGAMGAVSAASQARGEEEMSVYTDCRTIPKNYLDEIAANAGELEPPPIPPAICEFMLGHIVVGVIMPESNPGVGGLDWSDLEEQVAVEETIAAMEWWIRHGPVNGLWFSYDINYRVPVAVEPMTMGGDEVEDLWAGQSLEYLGYGGVNHVDQCYAYIDGLREEYGADWGFVSFILDGREDVSFGAFVAYGFIGGPFTVTINANGPIGPHNLDRIFGHVMGNTFYCLDEFGDSPFTCSDLSGYMNVENANKLRGGNGCKTSVPCIMRAASDPTLLEDMSPCYYTRGVVGWWDEDGDGIPDILDTDPVLESVGVDTVGLAGVIRGDTLFATELSFRGTAAAVPIPNNNSHSLNSHVDFTVERVSSEYRVNGGDWMRCESVDRRFDSSTEKFKFTASHLHPWFSNTIEVRAVTASGNVTPDSLCAALEFYVAKAGPQSAYLEVFSPSPTRPPVSIGFVPFDPSVPVGTFIPVQIAVYDVMGRKIRTVRSENLASGEFDRAEWDGEDSGGQQVVAGVYFIGMNCGGNKHAQKIIVIP